MTAGVPIDVAKALAGATIDSIEPVGGGRNSRVYHVRSAMADYALKHYPARSDDPRDRLGTEANALKLMERHQFGRVPRVVAADEKRGFSLLSWLDGVRISEVGEADIDQAASFLGAIHALRHDDMSLNLPPASEACLSGCELTRQIHARLAFLEAAGDAQLDAFLRGPFREKLARILPAARDRMAAAELDFDADLPRQWRSLVPSDFGFHNGMRQPDGALAFFDFEYFGWDDPVKLTADTMLHPGTAIPPPLVRRFRQAMGTIYGDDPGFTVRLDAFYPLFGLRWVLIVLNEFLPERWQHRVAAGAAGDWTSAKERQLAKAQIMLGQIEEAR